jgi:hypothetical protein
MEYSSLKKLDTILTTLAISENYSQGLSINQLVLKTQINFRDIMFILDKLKKDEYVTTLSLDGLADISPFTNEMYLLTFEGLVFYESGGYQLKIERDKANEKRIIHNERLLVGGTWFAGIGAFLLFFWQIIIYIFPTCKELLSAIHEK